MKYVKPYMGLVKQQLADDIITEQGLLLLSKGHILTEEDIKAIIIRQIDRIAIEEKRTSINEYMNHLQKMDSEFYQLYDTCLTTVKDLFQSASRQERIEQDTLFEIFDDLMSHMVSVPHLFIQLRTIKDIDHYTMQHSINVGIISALLARLMGLKGDEVIRIGHAGFLHDIGKALIPSSILQKPIVLTDVEFETVKKHPRLGYEILVKNEIKDPLVLTAALMHHERLNGKGYPLKKDGTNIPLVAQIVAIADVYDAISSERVYKKSFSPFHAYMELNQIAFQGELNAAIVLNFLQYISKLMEGQEVIMNDGQKATVILADPSEPHRPLVSMNGQFIDLRKERNRYIQELLIPMKYET
ncbi:MAG: HD-GYP domain-containing protein [Tepidibacillus sp.]